jgi:hypothetical protein
MKYSLINKSKPNTIISFLIILFCIIFTSCQEEHELGSMPDKSTLKFTIYQDQNADPSKNVIIMVNETPDVIPCWDYEFGRSQKQRDSINVIFRGDYVIKYSAITAGGIVYGDSTIINIPETKLNDPELWNYISGGVGNEKIWLLDIDAHFFAGPLFFYGTDDSWQTVTEGVKLPEGSDSWNWCPDYAGNTWLMSYGDYGTMTFNLENKPVVKANHKMLPSLGMQTGSFNIDVQNKTLTFVNVVQLHDSSRDKTVSEWSTVKILSLTENSMQLGVIRDRDPNEGKCLLVYNYVSKAYADAH